ncbi:MAG: sugar ABC transporter substrate-binding protein [Clostridia bacterium]
MKSKMRKLLALLLAMVFVTGCLSACKQSQPTENVASTEEKTAAPETEEIVLQFPHWFFSHGDAFGEWISPAIEEFESQNPGVKVNGYAVAYNEYWDKLDTAIASNAAPDVFAPNNTNLSKYIEADAVLALDEYIDMEDVHKNFAPIQTESVVAAGTDGKTYTLISDMGYYLPMYRPSIFKKAGIASYPTTPEEFIGAMGKLSTLSGVAPYAFMTTPGNYAEGAIDLSIWIIGLGGHYGENGKPTLDSAEVMKSFEYIKKLYDAGYIVKDTDKGTYRKMFATGNVGTLIDGQFMYSMLVGWDNTVEGDYEVANLPFPTQRCSSFYEGLSVSSTTKYPEQAAALVEFLCSYEQQQRILDITGIGSARADVLTDEAFSSSIYEKWPWMEAYANHLATAVLNNPDGIGGTELPEIQKILYTALERVLFENADINDALTSAQREALALFN